jgi:bifunctional DNA-binding transcriptional regulator/antitoxin component of YhaV-PrlF toxin-antitoxin module
MLHSVMAQRRFVTVQQRGVLALPKDVRVRFGLDRPGAQVEVVERADGVIELHPHLAIPADQAWFWADRWQRAEREVDDHVERGEITTHESTEEFLSSLERVQSDL